MQKKSVCRTPKNVIVAMQSLPKSHYGQHSLQAILTILHFLLVLLIHIPTKRQFPVCYYYSVEPLTANSEHCFHGHQFSLTAFFQPNKLCSTTGDMVTTKKVASKTTHPFSCWWKHQ
jgi:hypothetical protein